MNCHVVGFHQLIEKFIGHCKKQVTSNPSTLQEIQNESLDGHVIGFH